MIFRVDENAPKCISIHYSTKKWLWCLGHSFVAISGHYWPKNGHFSALPAFGRRRFNLNGIQSGWKWTHMYIYTWHIIIQRIQNPHLSMYLYIVFIIKKGINSIDHSFMAISGHYWLKNSHLYARWYPEGMKIHPNVYTPNVFNIKK